MSCAHVDGAADLAGVGLGCRQKSSRLTLAECCHVYLVEGLWGALEIRGAHSEGHRRLPGWRLFEEAFEMEENSVECTGQGD